MSSFKIPWAANYLGDKQNTEVSEKESQVGFSLRLRRMTSVNFLWRQRGLSRLPGIENQAIRLSDLREMLMEFQGICPVLCANETLKNIRRVLPFSGAFLRHLRRWWVRDPHRWSSLGMLRRANEQSLESPYFSARPSGSSEHEGVIYSLELGLPPA